ncbi:MAG: XRE family transcriptional regulator [Okeania sp. SIO3I5]|uniref:helix-turn-helix domain-containing protein n=1 Tax=Okeania sp. SIO3I5 TaxID=2607805 RepID=UPI0013B7CF7B|nr:XRE family transcriptional regulator [Okeania sp. SIO3I5]NEQ36681.1 XRE family transcriptional regulator [Okeania sp. SIO3I5]
MIEKPIFEENSGNVFADLGWDDAEELFTRGKIGIQVIRLLKKRHLKQDEISEILGISQREVSHLMNGEFQRFSEGKLLNFLKGLDLEITLHFRSRNGEIQDIETAIARKILDNLRKFRWTLNPCIRAIIRVSSLRVHQKFKGLILPCLNSALATVDFASSAS